jgi:hypothetical protein
MSGRESLGADDGKADDGKCENFHRFAGPARHLRHARHIIPDYDTTGRTLTSRLCRVPEPEDNRSCGNGKGGVSSGAETVTEGNRLCGW